MQGVPSAVWLGVGGGGLTLEVFFDSEAEQYQRWFSSNESAMSTIHAFFNFSFLFCKCNAEAFYFWFKVCPWPHADD
jgi:hypothetical protein